LWPEATTPSLRVLPSSRIGGLIGQYRLEVLTLSKQANHVDEFRPLDVEPTNRKASHRPGSKALDASDLAQPRRPDARHALDRVCSFTRRIEAAFGQAWPPCAAYPCAISMRSISARGRSTTRFTRWCEVPMPADQPNPTRSFHVAGPTQALPRSIRASVLQLAARGRDEPSLEGIRPHRRSRRCEHAHRRTREARRAFQRSRAWLASDFPCVPAVCALSGRARHHMLRRYCPPTSNSALVIWPRLHTRTASISTSNTLRLSITER
jgi:hypothetical protein